MALIFKLGFPSSIPGNVEFGSAGVVLPVAGRAAPAFATVPVPVSGVEPAADTANVVELVPKDDEAVTASEVEAEAVVLPVVSVGRASVTLAVEVEGGSRVREWPKARSSSTNCTALSPVSVSFSICSHTNATSSCPLW